MIEEKKAIEVTETVPPDEPDYEALVNKILPKQYRDWKDAFSRAAADRPGSSTYSII
jgi:hypothetical protein